MLTKTVRGGVGCLVYLCTGNCFNESVLFGVTKHNNHVCLYLVLCISFGGCYYTNGGITFAESSRLLLATTRVSRSGVVFLEIQVSEMAVRLNRLVIFKSEAHVRGLFWVPLGKHNAKCVLLDETSMEWNMEIEITE